MRKRGSRFVASQAERSECRESQSTQREFELAAERKSERMDTAYSPRLHEEELSADANAIQELRLAAERKSERMDTAHSPRLHAETDERHPVVPMGSP